MSRKSRRNEPKNGTTQHSGIVRALVSALSYSTESRAADKKSRVGTGSFSVMDNQKGLSLVDLETK